MIMELEINIIVVERVKEYLEILREVICSIMIRFNYFYLFEKLLYFIIIL